MSSSAEGEEQFPLRYFSIIDSTHPDPTKNQFLELKKFNDPETKETLKAECFVLIEKFTKLRLKVEERVPIHSRLKQYKWFVIMDTYGFIYMMMINIHWFQEKLLFSMLDKIKRIMQNNKQNIFKKREKDTEDLEPVKESILSILNTYNDTLANDENPEDVYSEESKQYSIMSVSNQKSFDKQTIPMEEDENLFHIKSRF